MDHFPRVCPSIFRFPKKMANNRLVWFLLVDGEGQAFRGTTASSVDIPSDYVIDQFRDAVKEKYADSHLKGIAPSDLIVYANDEEFEAGNALEEDEEIGIRASRKANALLVAVLASHYALPAATLVSKVSDIDMGSVGAILDFQFNIRLALLTEVKISVIGIVCTVVS